MFNQLETDIRHKMIDGRTHTEGLVGRAVSEVIVPATQGWPPQLVSVTAEDLEHFHLL